MPTITGTNGDDSLYGSNGNDTLDGGAGNDILYGFGGADSLTGGPGYDVLRGGDGDDVYIIQDILDRILETDTGGIDTAYVYANFVKLPSTVENIFYMNGAQALPYWIDALLGDDAAGDYYRWLLGETLTFQYTFPESLPTYNNQPGDGTGYTPLNNSQIMQVETALSYVASITALTFTRSETANALNTLSFAYNTQTNSGAYAYLPENYALASDVFLTMPATTPP